MTKPRPEPRREARRPGRPPEAEGVQGRETLLRAARELMVERGFPRVTVREVAKRAGVGPALVNYYFGGKSDLFAAIIEQVALETRERLERVKQQSGPITERIRGFVREFVDAMAADPYLPRLLAEQVLFADDEVIDRFARELAAPNLAAIRNLLTEGIASGELREVDPSMVGVCLYFFLAARLVCRLFDLEKITPALADDFAESTADLILHGLLLRTSTT
jgi:AcrR family transcriptional regulator